MRLSVCIITYNHEQFIEQCIRSVLDQDIGFDYEVVVGDDCSTDSTTSILEKIKSEKHNRLKIIYNKANIGSRANFNRTLAACKGEFIAFLEGDDYWTSSHKLRLQVDFLDQHPQASGVFHRTRLIDATEPSRQLFFPYSDAPEFCSFDFLFQFDEGNPIAVGSLMARRKCMADIDSWLADVKPGDWLIGMMLTTKGPLGFIPLEMSHYRLHAAGHWTRLNPHSQIARVIHMLRHVSGLVEGANKELVDQRLDTLTRWWSNDVVANGEVPFENTVEELDKIGDVRISNRLLEKVVSVARTLNYAKRELDEICARLRRESAELGEQLSELRAAVAQREARIAELGGQLSTTAMNLSHTRRENEQMRADAFWRMTRPLRQASDLLRRARTRRRSCAADEFDRDFYLKKYPDVVGSGCDPEVHYRQFGKAEGRLGNPRQLGLVNAADEFDRDFYLKMYPDVGGSGCDPETHYRQFGKSEGRLGSPPQLDLVGSLSSFDSECETVLVVSHEASLTGAPVLSLNIVQQLSLRYNVVAMLLGGGVIDDAFREAGAVVVRASAARGHPTIADSIIQALAQQVEFKFALVNSIESRWVLPALAKVGVPTVSLIHEFAAYTRPKQAFRDALFWSTEVVFSTEITLESARAELPDIEEWPLLPIIPQGRCTIPKLDLDAQRLSEERARVAGSLRSPRDRDRKFIVLGAGSVEIRKGVDLFIQCAAHVLRQVGADRVRFVWIGGGFNPEQDAGYSVYLADQIRRAGVQDMVAFMEATPAIEAAYEEADVLLLSARLDPLPNVAIDAMAYGLPVLCFESTTGIAAILRDARLGDACVASYLDVEDMARKVVALLESDTLRLDVGERSRAFALEHFDISRYVAMLEDCAASACQRLQQERRDAEEIHRAGQMQMDFAVPPHMRALTSEEFTVQYVRGWASGVMCRKPVPGFHPGIYKARHGLRQVSADPYADYLREGCPTGPWQTSVINEKTPIPLAAGVRLRVAIHLHVSQPEIVHAFVERLSVNALRADLFVSVSSDEVCNLVMAQLNGYEGCVRDVKVVVNRGRDIGPLLTAFGAALVQDYDVVGHFHTNASEPLDDGKSQSWNPFILENLLGGRMADRIVGAMAADNSLGLVFPDNPYVVGWSQNRTHAHDLAARLGLDENLPDQFNFPVGTMFWARAAVLQPLVDLRLAWSDYPEEPLAHDGTILDAIERLLPMVAERIGLRCIVTNVAGVGR